MYTLKYAGIKHSPIWLGWKDEDECSVTYYSGSYGVYMAGMGSTRLLCRGHTFA